MKDRHETDRPRRAFSLELAIVIAIPLLTIAASLVTLALASHLGFTASQEVQLDRFARDTEEAGR